MKAYHGYADGILGGGGTGTGTGVEAGESRASANTGGGRGVGRVDASGHQAESDTWASGNRSHRDASHDSALDSRCDLESKAKAVWGHALSGDSNVSGPDGGSININGNHDGS